MVGRGQTGWYNRPRGLRRGWELASVVSVCRRQVHGVALLDVCNGARAVMRAVFMHVHQEQGANWQQHLLKRQAILLVISAEDDQEGHDPGSAQGQHCQVRE